MSEKCFICGEYNLNDKNSQGLENLSALKSTKYETAFTEIIKDIVLNDAELEIRINSSDRICRSCYTLTNELDRLIRDAKTIRNVLNRQIFRTYEIEIEKENEVFIDKSKTFVELVEKIEGHQKTPKYQCIHCNFETINLENVNSHVLYHQLIAESENAGKFNDSKTLPNVNPEESIDEAQKLADIVKDILDEETEVVTANPLPKYDIDELEEKIDLILLENPRAFFNLKPGKCYACSYSINYAADYINHLKTRHKTPSARIFNLIKANLIEPKHKIDKTCPFCFTSFRQKENFEAHVTKLHENAYKCNSSDERLNDFIVSMVQSSRCKVCDYECGPSGNAEDCTHDIAKENSPKMICQVCLTFFYNEKLYNNHLAIKHNFCFICMEKQKPEIKLKDHFNLHLNELPYKCVSCKQNFLSKADYDQHLKNHNINICVECKQVFSSFKGLLNHNRYRHADKKPIRLNPTICDHCGHTFRTTSQYEQHIKQIHSKAVKSFQCKICNQKYLFKYLLIHHLEEEHGRNIKFLDQKFYQCYLCDRQFSYMERNDVQKHLESHEPNTYNCQDCDESYLKYKSYEQHREKAHNDFSCNLTPQNIPRKIFKESTADESKNPLKIHSNVQIPTSTVVNRKVIVKKPPKPPTPATVSEPPVIVNDPPKEQQQNEESNTLILPHNFLLTEDGQIIIQNLDELTSANLQTDENGQQQLINLQELLSQTNFVLTTEDEASAGDGNMVHQIELQSNEQKEMMDGMQEYNIFQPENNTVNQMVSIDEMELTNGYNIIPGEQFTATTSSLNSENTNNNSNEIVLQEVVVEEEATQVSETNKTLDELSDILKEVAAQAEKPILKRSHEIGDQNQDSPRKQGRRANENRRLYKQLPSESNNFSNFSAAFQHFVQGFDAKKKFMKN